jgi:hypothetical protein
MTVEMPAEKTMVRCMYILLGRLTLQQNSETTGIEPKPFGDEKPSTTSTSTKPWLTPDVIRLLIQSLAGLLFCALLIPFARYTRTQKTFACEDCKIAAAQLYEETLGKCEAIAARNISIRHGMLGLSWLEIVAIIATAAGVQ